MGWGRVDVRHASEQYLTCSQSRSHFLRQANGRWQRSQILVGKWDLLGLCRFGCLLMEMGRLP
ncbi:hypothetical protein VN12_06590 [Pirellula sp. SH-Sr6A]|nr:hypothetical protein VN12_06590 [Pirellula sp. SH-Sr6A]